MITSRNMWSVYKWDKKLASADGIHWWVSHWISPETNQPPQQALGLCILLTKSTTTITAFPGSTWQKTFWLFCWASTFSHHTVSVIVKDCHANCLLCQKKCSHGALCRTSSSLCLLTWLHAQTVPFSNSFHWPLAPNLMSVEHRMHRTKGALVPLPDNASMQFPLLVLLCLTVVSQRMLNLVLLLYRCPPP